MANRMSMYSVGSEMPGGPRGPGQQATQVSTTTLLNSIHHIYLSGTSYSLDAGSSVVVNTWLTASQLGSDGRAGGTVDAELGRKAWEHARRRAEDGCVVLGSLHTSAPSVLVPFLSSLPMSTPSSLHKALDAIQPFLRCATPFNPSTPRQAALGVSLTLTLAGNLHSAKIAISRGGIDTGAGLLNVPKEAGYRAFDVFYYLLTSASTPAEREFLGLKPASEYAFLARSGTYSPPAYLPTADDNAAADDFRASLKEIGIKGAAHRNLISTLAGLLKLGNTVDYQLDEDAFHEICEDVSGLLGMEPEFIANGCSTEDRQTFIGGLYEALVDWVITKANVTIAAQMIRIRDGDESIDGTRTPTSGEEHGDTVCLTVVEVPSPELGKALALRSIFDDSLGINAEMKQDGIEVPTAGSSVIREMQNAVAECAPDLGIMSGPTGRERQHTLEKREEVLEKIGLAADQDSFLNKLLFPVAGEGINLGQNARLDLPALLGSSRVWYHLSVHPTDEPPQSIAALPTVTSAWSAGTVSRQLRAWRLPEWANRRNKDLDFTADFDLDECTQRYQTLGCKDGKDGIESWVLERGWSNGEVVVGNERVWMHEHAWWEAESMLDMKPLQVPTGVGALAPFPSALETGYSTANESGYFGHGPYANASANDSSEGLMHDRTRSQAALPLGGALGGHSHAPSMAASRRNVSNGDYGLGNKGDDMHGKFYYNEDGEMVDLDPELAVNKHIETQTVTFGRRIWVALVWAMTFWIPSFVLRFIGRMKRPDVRMAWREKLVICMGIFLINAIVVFWIIWFGRILCPNFDKAWSTTEVSTHLGDDDFWVSIHGKVYDISTFWRTQHSDTDTETNSDNMQPFAGMNLDDYFTAPLTVSCPGIVTDETVVLMMNNTVEFPIGQHISGYYQTDPTTKLKSDSWYATYFQPKIKEYYKGDLVWNNSFIASDGQDNQHDWVIYSGGVYDFTNYFATTSYYKNTDRFNFLDASLTDAVKNAPGTDITDTWNGILKNAQTNTTAHNLLLNNVNCIKNTFYVGIPDFRLSARCQVNNYILLVFTILICAVILIKFLSALQFGSKRQPAPQDKFVICQVPAYTEGEDSLRKALDSLTALQYDNKRKLICVICDGNLTGAGNDRPTPKIVLDIFGVDPKVDPPALPFRSVGTGNEQLNYGKVYSGLYEYEGNVVPYVVIVKVGKESEQKKSKPGNRGKRDSQILLMSFLNRVHHRAAMSPLELEVFHQINNIIGVDPELYEYLLMVDADTCVREDSLNRLVAACANNSKIAGICGETSLQNEEHSWWTMIQVYEYFISHNLAKAFESLFGSVTCLPGCFTMYRLRTADRGKPLIISDQVIRDYSDCNVDTLHKKNLLSLGEDRYLTTLMTKYFPYMHYKFTPDAYCQTAAPETWSVLLSQRRRWINSTIHNLVELMRLKDMCGFCCFSMRFVVLVDLTGTIILPATTFYLGYLIYLVATHTGQFPLISIIMIAAVYGLQALIFILKRQWQHIGWMIIYILAFPVYSFVLPIYSFWNQDNFSWGNTRIVIGEKGQKQLVAVDDEGFDPRSIPLERWDDYAVRNALPGRRGGYSEKASEPNYEKPSYEMGGPGGEYEMDDMKSTYSSVRQSSILTGLAGRQQHAYVAPQSPAIYNAPGHMSRHSTMALPYTDAPMANRQSVYSLGNDLDRNMSPYQDAPHHASRTSIANLRGMSMTPTAHSTTAPFSPLGGQHHAQPRSNTALGFQGGARSPMSIHEAARQSMISMPDFQHGSPGLTGVPDDYVILEAIQVVLREVDLDTVTKKQVRALVEQRLQTELVGEKRTYMDRQIDNELANM